MDMEYSKQYAVLRLLSDALVEICACNRDLRSCAPTAYDAVSEPPMSVYDYLFRIRRYTKFNFNCFFVAVVYLRALAGQAVMLCMTKHNVHRLLLTAITVAAKASDDVYHANGFMARCGGISLPELNALELELCTQLDWKLVANRADVDQIPVALMRGDTAYWASFLNFSMERPSKHVLCKGDALESPAEKPLAGEDQVAGTMKAANGVITAETRPVWPGCLRRIDHVLRAGHQTFMTVGS